MQQVPLLVRHEQGTARTEGGEVAVPNRSERLLIPRLTLQSYLKAVPWGREGIRGLVQQGVVTDP